MLTEEQIIEKCNSPELQKLLDIAPKCDSPRCTADAVWSVTVFCTASLSHNELFYCHGCRNVLINIGLRAWTELSGHEHKLASEKLIDDPR
jgi:hypothetical protein